MKNEKHFLIPCVLILCLVIIAGAQCAAAQAQGAPDAAKRGVEIVSQAAAAAGGEAVKELKSVEFKAAGNITTPDGPAPVTAKSQVVFPDKSRLDVNLGAAVVSSGFDGKQAWVESPQGVIELPADLNAHALRAVDLTGALGLYKKSLNEKVEAEFAGETQLDGQPTWLVEWNGPSGKVKLYFDTTTKMLVAAKYRNPTMGGEFDEERRWSDFRAVDGVQFPHRWITYRDGALFSDLTVTEVKFNASIDAGTFAKPQ